MKASSLTRIAAAMQTSTSTTAAPSALNERAAIIANRGEFVDALRALLRGHMLVRASDQWGGCSIAGGIIQSAFRPLLEYRLIAEVDNPDGFNFVQYYRLTPRGRDFAAQACSAWDARPLFERLATRLLG